jgi:hypothetical protein
VRLVDHEQPYPLDEQRQHLVAELRVVQALRADEQEVDGVLRQQPLHLLPCVAVGRVDRVRPDPQPLGGGDLIAHQGQERRDDQRRPGAALAQQRGGDEVDGRLPPAGALDAEHARAVLDEVAHGLELVGAEGCVGAGEVGEEVVCAGVELRGHLPDSRPRPAETRPSAPAERPAVAAGAPSRCRRSAQPLPLQRAAAADRGRSAPLRRGRDLRAPRG